MRKNTKNVFNAWVKGHSEKKQNSIWTDGYKIYSYNTPILQYNDSGAIVIDMSKYSRTTTNHQNSIRRMCQETHIEYLEAVCSHPVICR